MLKILHVPYTYHPDPVGGTEIYVEQLVDALRARGVNSVIAAPGKTRLTYTWRDTCVERLAAPDAVRAVDQLYGEGDESAARAFGALLDTHAPQVAHLHAFTRIVSARFALQARARAIPVVFTYHTPTVSCLRSGLMLWGREPCDGVLEVDRCTCCRLHSLGLPIPLATVVARTPAPLRAWGAQFQGGVWTGLRMRDLVARQHDAVRGLMNEVDAVVALCEWTRQLLIKNKVSSAKIVVAPHGLTIENQEPHVARLDARQPDTLRVVTLGRLERIKGVDLLVRALAQIPNLQITLDIYGIIQSEKETPFARELRAEIAQDARIHLLPPVPHAQVISLLRQYDVLAVPSQWFETGPLVVLEAFAAHIPVIGSNLGGIAEKVADGVNGLLVSPLKVTAWRDALQRLAQDRAWYERLRANVRLPRTMDAVAQEMHALYESLVAKARA